MTRPALLLPLLAVLASCSAFGNNERVDWFGRGRPQREAGGSLSILWNQSLVDNELTEGHYLPVEYAAAALDPSHDRVYLGTTDGRFLAMSSDGRRIYGYRANSAIQAAPALERQSDEIYVATEDGKLHALRASTGERRWTGDIGASVRKAPLIASDAVYVITQSDRVVAFARENGDVLWSYQRPMPDGFTIATHAGLVEADGRIITGFTDGAVVGLDATDGRPLWEVPTAIDVEQEPGTQQRFLDVDTTPLVMGDTFYVASFAGGVYAMSVRNGTVQWRDGSYRGVVGLEGNGRFLVIASADEGIVTIDRNTREVLWRRSTMNGSPTEPALANGLIFVGEAEGSFYALRLTTGEEVGRIDAGHGFSARAAIRNGLGFVLSNGGSFFSFRVNEG